MRNLTSVNIAIPHQPKGAVDPSDATKWLPVTEVDLYLWKREHTKAQDRKDKYDENMAKAYIIVYHQCSQTLKNDLESSDSFATIRSAQDVIALLKLIQSLCCSYDAKTQGVMATVAFYKKLFTYYQKDGVDNHTYHQEFMAHVETLETYGGIGVVGVVPTFFTTKIKDLADAGDIADASNPTDAEQALAVSSVRGEFLAALMLSSANREHFGALRTDLKNQYGYGEDRYPKTTDNCLSLLNRWQPQKDLQVKTPRGARTHPTPPDKDKENDEALVFAQDAKKKSGTSGSNDDSSSSTGGSVRTSPKKPSNVCCLSCGKLGHTSCVCPNKKPPAQVHAITTDTDDASVPSDTSSVILIAQTNTRTSIDPDFLLLDSQSTVNLFSNPDHVDNVRPV